MTDATRADGAVTPVATTGVVARVVANLERAVKAPRATLGRFAEECSFASDSDEAVAALRRGDLTRRERPPRREHTSGADLAGDDVSLRSLRGGGAP
jgi:hypothetical protein